MHSWIARNLLYYPILAMRGERLRPYLRQVRAFNALTPDQMKADQWRRLQKLLMYVHAHSPYYRDRWNQAGISFADLKAPEDLARLPLVSKADIRTHSAAMMSTERQRVSHRHTSGSTGVPLHFVKDRDALAFMNAVMHDCYGWHGLAIGDPQCRVWALPLDLKRRLSVLTRDMLLNRIRLSSFDVSETSCRAFYRKALRFRPRFMYGFPTYMVALVQQLHPLGLDASALGLHVIIATGEVLYDEQKRILETAFGCRVVNEYGTTECGIIAFECPRGKMHVQGHNIFLELVHPETQTPVKPGETGQIVITELTSYAMPFVRYNIADLAVKLDEPCDCGLALPVVGHVEGRIADMVTTPEGKMVGSGMFYYTLSKGVNRFKVFQRSADHLEVFLERGPDFAKLDLEEIRRNWRDYLGPNMTVSFQIVDQIPADPSGKFRYLVTEYQGRKS